MKKLFRLPLSAAAVSFAFILSCAALLGGCTEIGGGNLTGYGSNAVLENGVHYQVHDRKRDAFAQTAYWDLDPAHTEIRIGDTADGAPVTSLGGYTGMGVPSPFMITPEEDAECFFSSGPDPAAYGSPVTWQDLIFTVHLGRNVSSASYTAGSGYVGIRQGNGSIAFYRPVVRFDCDPGNSTLYSRDGFLYLKSDDSPVKIDSGIQETSPAGPVFTELSFQEKVKGKYRTGIVDGEFDVYEFFSIAGSDTIYANIGTYTARPSMTPALNEYRALVLEPAAALPGSDGADGSGDPSGSSRDSGGQLFTARTFSSFSMAGQYLEEEPYTCRLIPDEDGLTIGSPDSGISIRLIRDQGAPSQFPSDPGMIGTVFPGPPGGIGRVFHSCPYYMHGIIRTPYAVVDLKEDMTVTVLIPSDDPDLPPEIYRGICDRVARRPGYGNDLRFCLTGLGYGAVPFTGRVTAGNDRVFRISDEPGNYEAFPFIPGGQEEAAWEGDG